MINSLRALFLLIGFGLISNSNVSSPDASPSGKPPLAPLLPHRDSRTPFLGIAIRSASPAGLPSPVSPASTDSVGFDCGSPLSLTSPVATRAPRELDRPDCLFASHYKGRTELCDGSCNNKADDLPRYYCFLSHCPCSADFDKGFMHLGAAVSHVQDAHGKRRVRSGAESGVKYKDLGSEHLAKLIGATKLLE